MAEGPDKDQKTEAPTAKRRRESAEKGETLQSRELATGLVIGAGVLWTAVGAGGLVVACRGIMRAGLSLADPVDSDLLAQLAALVRGLIGPLALFASFVIAGSVAGPLLLAPHFSSTAFMPKPSRLDPIGGLKRIFGFHAVTELGKAVLKAGLIFGAGIAVITARLPGIVVLGNGTFTSAAAHIASSISVLLLALLGALGVIAAVDLPLQLGRHLAKLRMSKQEVRQENRESDGSPETKMAQRRMARQAAKRSLAPAVASASVVIVNPSHFAVALRYVAGQDNAPIVVAKGLNVIAEAIRDLAGENDVPVLSYPLLTRAIYFTAMVGQPIRDELFGAVAAVLAFVLYLDRSTGTPPDVDTPETLRFDEAGVRQT